MEKNRDYSITELKEFFINNEKERNNKIDTISTLIYENTTQLSLLIHRIKTAKENVQKIKADICNLTKSIQF